MMRGTGGDEPITPAGRFFLHPSMQQIINCIIGFKDEIDVEAFKAEMEKTMISLHPRFRSLMVRDNKGREYWRKVDRVDLDKHVILVPEEEEDAGGEGFVNDYVAGLAVSMPLDTGKPLWEMHVLRSNRCCVLRLHHALGDGISLMSVFLASCRKTGDPSLPATVSWPKSAAASQGRGAKGKAASMRELVWKALFSFWFTLVYALDMLLHSLWVKDETTPVSGGDGVELWPRDLRTVTFSLGDMKAVKNAADATINDVLLAIISDGLSKYLATRGHSKSSKPIRVTGLSMVNTREQPGLQDLQYLLNNSKTRWGNQFGFILLPMRLDTRICQPLDHVMKMKELTKRKKLSMEAHFSYYIGALIMSLLGPYVATLLNYNIIANTTFTLSNIMGPSEEVTFAGNPIEFIRTTSTALPHAITMHAVSYIDKVDIQILVARDIIHDVDILVKCFENALDDMKSAS